RRRRVRGLGFQADSKTLHYAVGDRHREDEFAVLHGRAARGVRIEAPRAVVLALAVQWTAVGVLVAEHRRVDPDALLLGAILARAVADHGQMRDAHIFAHTNRQPPSPRARDVLALHDHVVVEDVIARELALRSADTDAVLVDAPDDIAEILVADVHLRIRPAVHVVPIVNALSEPEG